MHKYTGMLGATLFAMFLTGWVQAATVEIEWREPEKYRDIQAGNESPKNFQERVTATLTSYFEDAAEDHLAADQSLNLTITDVDLAGDVEYFFLDFPQGIRVMREVYFPSISFTYELKDAAGTVIKTGEENIKDMGYRFSGMMFIYEPPMNYEKRMIHDWFSETFD